MAQKKKTTKKKSAKKKKAAKKKTAKKKTAKKKTRKKTVKKTSSRKKGTGGKATRKKVKSASPKKAPASTPNTAAPRRDEEDLPKTKLTRKELNAFRKILLEKRRSIIGDMNGMEGEAIKDYQYSSSRDISNPNSDIADIGSENYETEFTLGLLESERNRLEEIDEALARIEDKTYGMCLATHKPIRKSRLKALPWCKYTLEHAESLEGNPGPHRRR